MKYLDCPEDGRHGVAEADTVGVAARILPEDQELDQAAQPLRVGAVESEAQKILRLNLKVDLLDGVLVAHHQALAGLVSRAASRSSGSSSTGQQSLSSGR